MIVLAAVVVLPAPSPAQDAAAQRISDLRANVVAITARWQDGSTVKTGFGIIVAERNGTLYIATANHIVRGKDPGELAPDPAVRFLEDQGNTYPGHLLASSDPGLDVAVLTVDAPANFFWRRDALSPRASSPRIGSPLWFIGRDAQWVLPETPGRVTQIIEAEGLVEASQLDVRVGSSGAPLLTSAGITGMIVVDTGSTVRAVAIDAIKSTFLKRPLPWDLLALDALAPLKDCDQCPDMIVIPGGKFAMGEADAGNGPVHEVSILPFAMGQTEITNSQWEACVRGGGCKEKAQIYEGLEADDQPAIGVSWFDATSYVAWLSRVTRQSYRLPSEAEWEYAARAGTTSRFYWRDDQAGEICHYANIADQTAWEALLGPTAAAYARPWFTLTQEGAQSLHPANCHDRFVWTSPGGSFKANPYGLYDILGNVAEWVEDCYRDSYVGAPVDGSARLDAGCTQRSARGQSWFATPVAVDVARRAGRDQQYTSPALGFRIARDVIRPPT
ncbi:SUMF1/EgtB/PvdO family nonheme iron enzyme [Rhizobium leguminosarum]|nr:SUMF1/EgtB/PvdO family nonheme iron enzyme [Rhizobium leguminosarum]